MIGPKKRAIAAWITLTIESLLLAAILLWPANLFAHEVRPALLELIEGQPGQFDVLWKQPVTDGKTLRLDPQLPQNCAAQNQRSNRFAGNIITERWRVNCPLNKGRIAVEGLERSLTDVFVRIEYADGRQRNKVLRPDNRIWQLDSKDEGLNGVSDYLVIGAEHMIFGYDHLLFVMGLTLLVARRQIIAVITSFTIAHSITLALTVFDVVALRSAPVELLIAASITLLAVENILKRRDQLTLAAQRPWLIAFVIGLIHGLGFAGALRDIGLPTGEEAWALILFNIGLELGQIAFVGLILLLVAVLKRYMPKYHQRAEYIAIYYIGAMGCFWFIDRLIG